MYVPETPLYLDVLQIWTSTQSQTLSHFEEKKLYDSARAYPGTSLPTTATCKQRLKPVSGTPEEELRHKRSISLSELNGGDPYIPEGEWERTERHASGEITHCPAPLSTRSCARKADPHTQIHSQILIHNPLQQNGSRKPQIRQGCTRDQLQPTTRFPMLREEARQQFARRASRQRIGIARPMQAPHRKQTLSHHPVPIPIRAASAPSCSCGPGCARHFEKRERAPPPTHP